MPQHKVHYYVESGWPDDYFAGCHIEEYHASTANEDKVTCKHCLRNLANERAQAQQKGPAS